MAKRVADEMGVEVRRGDLCSLIFGPWSLGVTKVNPCSDKATRTWRFEVAVGYDRAAWDSSGLIGVCVRIYNFTILMLKKVNL